MSYDSRYSPTRMARKISKKTDKLVNDETQEEALPNNAEKMNSMHPLGIDLRNPFPGNESKE